MANLFDYVEWRGDLTFDQSPFNKIDALLLAHLTYFIYDGIVSSGFEKNDRKSLEEIYTKIISTPDFEERKNIGLVINKRTFELLEACAKSARFSSCLLCGFENIFSEDKQEQFAAMTYLAGGKTLICYRGTDDTICGWREDFNIAYLPQIPGQVDALAYLEKAAQVFDGPFTLAGHSKGGNLAVNTAVRCGKIQKRIEDVYNFDGPGFIGDFFQSPEYKCLEGRVHSFYPEGSIVGMIFRHTDDYEIVKSDGKAVMQHDPLTWQLCGKEFEHCEDFNSESKLFYVAFNKWVDHLSEDSVEKFVTALFDVLYASGAKTLSDFAADPLASSMKMIEKYSSMDRETKTEVHSILVLLGKAIKAEFPLFKLLRGL